MLVALAIAVASLDLASVTATVRSAPTIPDRLVEDALREADAIWRSNGVALVWRTGQDVAPSADAALRVLFEDGASTMKDYAGMLGTIVFADGVPLPSIRLSYANALELLRERYGDGGVNRMTVVERRAHLARALGRALAHEIGHYVLASADHTASGLMKARLVANDLFGPSRGAFGLTDAQRCEALARLRSAEHLARR
jgi:hypothetical protein